ncbi:5-formyltetrahydrofolate cyclo-ligase [Anaerobacillus alkalidiazotrophicus]|uniref:5-formyltetrahydrofolate cyclo-ligase n=1 Tax=Anaerobacillus alkalidiazotrophicus TaxID=472963 RepID=A0A1S2MBT8_9BACI|nr:5-formyltetrahydrofolate cyclo-ligase [Anaerobacillus alkalidiazotrophicus]OIJ22181.1 5-formyltetrahydrofolate cyclo-ligase [Anaerobacillus alkalidiazotrophicus]
MKKTYLRNKVKKCLQEMSNADYVELSSTIKKRFITSEEWKSSKTIGITISTQREVDTKSIIEEGWRQNKRIVVPKCFPKEKELKFYEINSFTDLEESFYALKEPITTKTTFVAKENIDLLVVPGVVFDTRGYRIGYGGGYYDRYLINYKNKKISLAFHFQIINEVPNEHHDIAVDKIICNT